MKMEKPKIIIREETKEKIPRHEIELEKNPNPLKGESYEDWLRRIGGPFVKVGLLKKCPKCGGTIFLEGEHFCKPTDEQKKEMPLIIDKNATFVVNKENIANYFNKDMLDEKLELEERQSNVCFIKKRGEYQIKKELFKNPEVYKNIIKKELKRGNGKIVADERFGKSLKVGEGIKGEGGRS